MTSARPRGSGARRLRRLTALLLLLAPAPAAGESPAASDEDASVRSETEKIRANQERAIQEAEKRLAEIWAREAGIDEARRAGKITADRILAAGAALTGAGLPAGVASKGETWGQTLARMAEVADRDPGTMAAVYRAQEEYVADATAHWVDGPDRQKLQEAAAQLQKNMEAVKSSLTLTIETTLAVPARLSQAQLLEKATRIEAAAKEASARLSARWERERAAREREREQREREAGERAREQRR